MLPDRFQHRGRRAFAAAAGVASCLIICGNALAANACGSLENAYGPYDYRTQRDKLAVVEQFHFTTEVEAMLRPKSAGQVGGDLDYTLRAFPNHHRALIATVRLGERDRSAHPSGLPRPIECYFDRAVRFKPQDQVVRMLYARFLVAGNRAAEAEPHLEEALRSPESSPLTNYNVGLIYFEMKAYAKALKQAHLALEQGYGATGLKEKLQQAGQWREPTQTSPPEPDKAKQPS
jgi:tetratricopeptide (TPR) repeat protein